MLIPARVPARAAAIVLVVASVSLLISSIAFARITLNTIDDVATVTENGRHILATGPISCTEREVVHLRVTVTQRSTGAVAEGRTRFRCVPEVRQWKVHASTFTDATFEQGPATAVALGRSTRNGEETDAHQWLVDVLLEEE